MKNISKYDYEIGKFINYSLNNKYLRDLPVYFGLIPYEIYVLPGMYIAIILTIINKSISPIRFHLLPHFFAYSFFQLLKSNVYRVRPGCKKKNTKIFNIDKGHCDKRTFKQSFPSGHTGIAFSLATALAYEMYYTEDSRFFEIPIKDKKTKNIIVFLGFSVAIFVAIHRIAKGYHHFSDTIMGAILGISIGVISSTVLYKREENAKEKNLLSDNKKYILDIILICFILFLFYRFLTIDLYQLTSIKH